MYMNFIIIYTNIKHRLRRGKIQGDLLLQHNFVNNLGNTSEFCEFILVSLK